MPKEKQEKKKPKIVRRTLKWLGLGLLAILLILGIIFQAPWKVITLLVIILLACTVLPKPYRKWFWLSAAVIVIALIIWVFLPDDNGDWRPYTFDEELAALEAKYAIPDSENAAVIYNQLFNVSILDGNEPEFLVRSNPSSVSEPWFAEDHPEAAEWLQKQKSTIAILMRACQKKQCRFEIQVAWGSFPDYYSDMRQLAHLLISAANNDIAENRTNAGLEKYLSVIQIAKHLYQQLTIIDFLVGAAVEDLATTRLKRFIVTANPTEEHLTLIEEALSETKHDWGSNLPKFLEHDKLMAKSLLSMAYEINPKGKVRLSRDPIAAIRAQFSEELPPLTYWQRKLAKAGTILGWFFVPATPQKAAKIIDAAYQRYYAMAEPDFDWTHEPQKPLLLLTASNFTRIRFNYHYFTELIADMSEEGYHRIHDIYLRTTAEQRGSQIIIALSRYKNKIGHWPESLDDIKSLAPAEIFVDPINDSSFVYKLTEENFKLYSKGKNNIDEDGQYNTKWAPDYSWHKVEEDDRLIWPPRSRKAKEEKTDAEQQ